MALSVRSGIVDIDLIGTQFEFFTTTPAIILLGIAMLAEFAAYYVPFIDNLLDTIATPADDNLRSRNDCNLTEGSEPVIQWQ